METTKARWITVEEMRDRLSISRNKAYEISSSEAIETVKIGRALRINEESLNRWLESLKYSNTQGDGDMD